MSSSGEEEVKQACVCACVHIHTFGCVSDEGMELFKFLKRQMDLQDLTLLTPFHISHTEKESQNKRCWNMGNTAVAEVISGLKTPGVLLFNFLVQQDQGINSLWLCFLPLFLWAVFDLCFTCRSAIHTLKEIIYSALHRVRLNHENPFYFIFWMLSKLHTHTHAYVLPRTHTHIVCVKD